MFKLIVAYGSPRPGEWLVVHQFDKPKISTEWQCSAYLDDLANAALNRTSDNRFYSLAATINRHRMYSCGCRDRVLFGDIPEFVPDKVSAAIIHAEWSRTLRRRFVHTDEHIPLGKLEELFDRRRSTMGYNVPEAELLIRRIVREIAEIARLPVTADALARIEREDAERRRFLDEASEIENTLAESAAYTLGVRRVQTEYLAGRMAPSSPARIKATDDAIDLVAGLNAEQLEYQMGEHRLALPSAG